MTNWILPIAAGANTGLFLDSLKRAEDSVRVGGNEYLTAISQFAEEFKAIGFADTALEITGNSPVSLFGRRVLYLTPFVLAFLNNCDLQIEPLRKGIAFLQSQIGSLCQIAAVVSSFVLIYFGNLALGASALVFLGIGYMHRSPLLPSRIRQFTLQASGPLMIGACFLSGGWIDQLYATINVMIICSNFFSSWQKNRSPKPQNTALQNRLTLDSLDNFLNDRCKIEVNRSYVYESTLPPAPEIDIREVLPLFKAIDWNRHMGALRAKLKGDDRYRKYHGDPKTKTDLELQKFANKSLKSFIDSIIYKRVLAGEPLDYERLHHYMKIITSTLKKMKNEIDRTDILLRLAIEGGDYCGPGKFEVAETVCASIIPEIRNLPLRLRILNCLQDERTRVWQSIYQKDTDLPEELENILETRDLHFSNIWLNLYGSHFGLRKSGADNDSLAVIDPLEKFFFSLIRGDKIQEELWKLHKEEELTVAISEAAGNSVLPKGQIYEWWCNWVNRQSFESEKKEALLEEMIDFPPTILGKRVEGENRQIHPGLIRAMLYDMGILEATFYI